MSIFNILAILEYEDGWKPLIPSEACAVKKSVEIVEINTFASHETTPSPEKHFAVRAPEMGLPYVPMYIYISRSRR